MANEMIERSKQIQQRLEELADNIEEIVRYQKNDSEGKKSNGVQEKSLILKFKNQLKDLQTDFQK